MHMVSFATVALFKTYIPPLMMMRTIVYLRDVADVVNDEQLQSLTLTLLLWEVLSHPSCLPKWYLSAC